MAYSTQRTTSDGTLVLLDISIEYFDRSEIAVLFNGVVGAYPWAWVGDTEKKISFSPAVPNTVEVMLVRTTDLAAVRHMFTLGAQFTTQSLDEDLLQILHIAQEAKENATIEEVFHNLNMHGYRIVNIGDGIDAQDAPSMAQMVVHDAQIVVYRDQAAASAAAAADSAAEAANIIGAGAASLVGADDGVFGTLWTTVQGFINKLLSSAGSSVIGFLQSGTAPATRTVQAKLRDFVSVADFSGADSTGATASTAAFRNAASAAGNGACIVPPGTWLLDNSVSYPCEFWFMPGASLVGDSGKYITGKMADLADRDYECMMGMGYFNIWLEGTTFSSPASNTFVATMWQAQYNGTAGTFTVDQAGGPLSVGAYNGLRWNQTVAGVGSTYRQLEFRVEDGTTYNNGKATLSFLAMCETGTVGCSANVVQFFGTGGSPSSPVTAVSHAFTATTSWQRVTVTFDMPNTASKTFGSSIDDCLKVAIAFPATGVFNVALQEVKLERGPIRTPFSALPLSLQHGYIDRYFQTCVMSIGDRAVVGGEQVFENIPFKTEMRRAPTITFDGVTLSGSSANLAAGPTANFVQKYGAACFIQAAAAGAYYAVGQLTKMDARL